MNDTAAMPLLSTAPHIRTKNSLPVVMWTVSAALLPAGVWAVYVFGISVLWTIFLAVGTAVLTEAVLHRMLKKDFSIQDGSAFLTGLLVAYNLPASVQGTLPWYIPVTASFFAIAVVKTAFGGIGQNWMNPALGGRIFVFFAWLTPMTGNWAVPFHPDTVSAATPLKVLKFGGGDLPGYFDLFIGKIPGCIGEISAAALLAGGIFLIFRKIVNWEIPVFYIGTAALLSWIFGGFAVNNGGSGLFSGDPLYHVLTGGLMLGAFFMATDWVTTPLTFKGRVLYAVGCGVLTVVIRLTGRNVEGVSFAIVLMNIAVPLIDRLSRAPIFGRDTDLQKEAAE